MILTVTLNPTIDRVIEVADFRIGAHAKARLVGATPGGKGTNVARGLARLGVAAAATGLVGRGQMRTFTDTMRAEGVQADYCAVDGETRTNITILDPAAHTSTHLRMPGFEVVADDLERFRNHLTGMLSDAANSTVVFAGSLPPGCEPEDLVGLLTLCREQGAKNVIDAHGEALRAAVGSGFADTVKPNLEELGECLGTELDAADGPDAARDLLDRTDTVLLTLGAEGAYLVRHDLTAGMRCTLRPDEVRNTVGAGDAFLAGWLKGLKCSDDAVGALHWAVATGAASAESDMTVGYRLADVSGLLERCECL